MNNSFFRNIPKSRLFNDDLNNNILPSIPQSIIPNFAFPQFIPQQTPPPPQIIPQKEIRYIPINTNNNNNDYQPRRDNTSSLDPTLLLLLAMMNNNNNDHQPIFIPQPIYQPIPQQPMMHQYIPQYPSYHVQNPTNVTCQNVYPNLPNDIMDLKYRMEELRNLIIDQQNWVFDNFEQLKWNDLQNQQYLQQPVQQIIQPQPQPQIQPQEKTVIHHQPVEAYNDSDLFNFIHNNHIENMNKLNSIEERISYLENDHRDIFDSISINAQNHANDHKNIFDALSTNAKNDENDHRDLYNLCSGLYNNQQPVVYQQPTEATQSIEPQQIYNNYYYQQPEKQYHQEPQQDYYQQDYYQQPAETTQTTEPQQVYNNYYYQQPEQQYYQEPQQQEEYYQQEPEYQEYYEEPQEQYYEEQATPEQGQYYEEEPVGELYDDYYMNDNNYKEFMKILKNDIEK